jgi:hypothetical protein
MLMLLIYNYTLQILHSEKDKTLSMDGEHFYHFHLKEQNINICSFQIAKQS